jgi:hypothetical protein
VMKLDKLSVVKDAKTDAFPTVLFERRIGFKDVAIYLGDAKGEVRPEIVIDEEEAYCLIFRKYEDWPS